MGKVTSTSRDCERRRSRSLARRCNRWFLRWIAGLGRGAVWCLRLGDKRRTKRLIKMAEQVSDNPSAGFCAQMETWGDLKAAYRLFAEDDVTFEAIARPHWSRPSEWRQGVAWSSTTRPNWISASGTTFRASPPSEWQWARVLIAQCDMLDANSQEILAWLDRRFIIAKRDRRRERCATFETRA